MPPTNSLRLIAGGSEPGETATLKNLPSLLPQLTRRPGEHLELYDFGSAASLAPIRRAARKRGFDSETALALAIERALVVADIEARAGRPMLATLDERSIATMVNVGLCSAHSSYLQHLLGRHAAEGSSRPLNSPRVALPVRLMDRLGSRNFVLDGDADRQLAAAIQWEISALAEGETISEWAYRTLALQLLN